MAIWAVFMLATCGVGLELVARLVLDDPIDPKLVGLSDRNGNEKRMHPPTSWTTSQGVEIHINNLGFRARAAESIQRRWQA